MNTSGCKYQDVNAGKQRNWPLLVLKILRRLYVDDICSGGILVALKIRLWVTDQKIRGLNLSTSSGL